MATTILRHCSLTAWRPQYTRRATGREMKRNGFLLCWWPQDAVTGSLDTVINSQQRIIVVICLLPVFLLLLNYVTLQHESWRRGLCNFFGFYYLYLRWDDFTKKPINETLKMADYCKLLYLASHAWRNYKTWILSICSAMLASAPVPFVFMRNISSLSAIGLGGAVVVVSVFISAFPILPQRPRAQRR